MKTPKYSEKMEPHTMLFPRHIWKKVIERAKTLSHEEKKYYSGSDVVRKATEEFLEK